MSARLKIVILFFLFSIMSYSQSISKGNIKGIILDAETNQHVSYAVLEIMDGIKFRTTKEDGTFSFDDILPGNYRLKINHVNYGESTREISVFPGKTSEYKIFLFPVVYKMQKVVVKSQHISSKLNNMYELSYILQGKELQKDLGSTLAATLRNEPGVSIRSMGPAPARPVIRGLSGDRVTINEDGVKSSDLSSTSPDHAVSLEPFTIERVEILRGPKVLTKSPTSIGGIVNVIRNEIPAKFEDHVTGAVGLSGESVNKSAIGSVTMEIPCKPFSMKLELSKRRSGNLNTPIGHLENSSMQNSNLSIGGSYFYDNGFIELSMHGFEMEYEIPGGFVGAHPNGVDINMNKKQYNLKSRYYIDETRKEYFDLNLSRIYYRHIEYESLGLIGAEFKIIDYLGNFDFHHRQIGFFDNGILGFSVQQRDFDIGGFVFTPQSKSFNMAAYVFESFSYNTINLEFGMRLNYDKITPDEEKPNATIGYIRQIDYLTYSISFSALYELTHNLYAGMNINKSSRVPTIEELYSEGPHLAAYSYETGNPNLSSESGLGMELFGYYKSDDFYFMANYFLNRMTSFIIPRNTGRLNYTQLLPVYSSEAVDALLFGFETEFDWKITENLGLHLTTDFTNGSFIETHDPLPQIPPVKGNMEIKYFSDEYSAGITMDFAGEQNRVDEFEEPTKGYFVLGVFGQYSFHSSSLIHNINVNFENILNTEYRNHLSRIKSVLPEAGFNAKITYKVFFRF